MSVLRFMGRDQLTDNVIPFEGDRIATDGDSGPNPSGFAWSGFLIGFCCVGFGFHVTFSGMAGRVSGGNLVGEPSCPCEWVVCG